jgi:hypothetical protein
MKRREFLILVKEDLGVNYCIVRRKSDEKNEALAICGNDGVDPVVPHSLLNGLSLESVAANGRVIAANVPTISSAEGQ